MSEIRIAGVVSDSIVDGPGVRYTIFTQGCPHNCSGCHNPHTHSYDGGQLVDIDDIILDIESYKYIKGVTFSGGDPLEQPEALEEFISKLKAKDFHVLIFSGYTFEQILQDENKFAAICKADVLIDGKFDIKQRSLSLTFKGSSNQRTINIQQTIAQNKIVLMDY